MVLKKMKLLSHCSRVCSPILHAHVGRAAADHELEVELLVGRALQEVGNDQAVGGEQVGLAGDVGGCGRRIVLGAHDVGARIHGGEAEILRRTLGGDDLERAELVGADFTLALFGP